MGVRPHRAIPHLRPRPGGHRAVGPGGQGSEHARAPAARHPGRHPRLCQHGDVLHHGGVLEVVDQCLELGYRAIKLHAWGDPRADAELCQKLRAHVGDEVPLMFDGSAGFDFADALYVGQAQYKGGIAGAMRITHLADSFQLRAEVHGAGVVNAHLCMAIPKCPHRSQGSATARTIDVPDS
ncbi:enolase C-terminal domain-like protein [Nonomuraea sp. NPDC050451]|uniref:enolase C-terminal domain-like protein n=1 Tax=Nonomuraea sp. NPDC050451 TaxID=3364364 RepID=UPI0037B0B05A